MGGLTKRERPYVNYVTLSLTQITPHPSRFGVYEAQRRNQAIGAPIEPAVLLHSYEKMVLLVVAGHSFAVWKSKDVHELPCLAPRSTI